jgi:hypothetical protein
VKEFGKSKESQQKWSAQVGAMAKLSTAREHSGTDSANNFDQTLQNV